MNNENFNAGNPQQGQNGSSAFGAPQNGQYGAPQGGMPMNGAPQYGAPQGQWQQPEPPKKKNWFLRHKILTGIVALCVVGGIATAGGGGGNKSTSTSSSSDSKSGSSSAGTKAEEKKDALPAIGTAVKDGDLEFTVTSVERDQPSVGDQYLNEKAQGSFTLVHVTVKNTGTKAETIMADGQKAYDAKGIGYEANSTASIYVKGNDTFFKEINPGNSLKGVFVFDAPKGTKLTKVRLFESMFSDGVEASL